MISKIKSASISRGDIVPGVTKPVTQENINLYAEASGDFNPIHIDKDFAATTPLGGTVAHGMLILAYVSEMMAAAFGGSWYAGGKLSVRFKAPARPGDTITVNGRVDSIKAQDGVSDITCSIEARNQGGEVVVTGEAVVKHPDTVDECRGGR